MQRSGFMAPRIDDHAAIGDGRSVALVTRDGTIDWLCWPRFESGAVFASLLDPAPGRGAWSIELAEPATITRRYVPDSNVLETRFETAHGVLTVIDSMTVTSEERKRVAPLPEHELLRIVRCDRGSVAATLRCELRPGFGMDAVRLRDAGVFGIRCESAACLFTLRGDVPIRLVDATAVAQISLAAGATAAFSLTFDCGGPALFPPLGEHALARTAESVRWWQGWVGQMTYVGPDRDLVARSLLVLKLLSYPPSGAVVAAPTTSLPERIGGDLNWDYRFCWLRDAALTTHAMRELGFVAESDAFVSWLLHTTRLTRPELRVLYDVFGNLPHDEATLALAGYRDSRPVRIRNAAANQLQLDCYGEVISAVVQVDAKHLDRETGRMLADFGRFVCEHWREPDFGIWEEREPPRHHTYSKAMCWIALDRLIELAMHGHLRVPLDDMRAQRAAIRDDIETNAFDPALGSYTQTYGGGDIDASLVLLGWYGFADPASPRMQGTYREIVRRLQVAPGLFMRNERGLAKREGAFGICSFWVAEFLARGGGTLAEARSTFDAALAYANDLGLFGEEIDAQTGEALGNFPQAYTHVGVINAAMAIASRSEIRRAA